MLGRYYWRTGCVRRDGEECWRAGTPQRHLGNSAPGIPGPLYFLPDNRSARAANAAPTLRRHAATGDDRHSARLQPEAPDRRRRISVARPAVGVCGVGCPIRLARCGSPRTQTGGDIADARAAVLFVALARAAYPQHCSSTANSPWWPTLAGRTRVVTSFQIHASRTDS